MSKIQKLPQNILEDIKTYLVSGEVVGKALYQDSQLPTKIWLIETNQAIIFHGQEPDQKPVVMVCPADEIREIDYLQKEDYVNVVFYYGKNGKAGFRFKKEDSKEIDEFLMNFSDLITARYKDKNGKIHILQSALPIGDKDRKVFGRGREEVKRKGEEGRGREEEEKKKEEEKREGEEERKKEEEGRGRGRGRGSEEKGEGKKEEEGNRKGEGEKKGEEGKKVDFSFHALPNKKEALKEEKPGNDKDYGNPLYFISVTIIATLTAFLCLTFFKTLSRMAKYFKKS